MCIHSVNPGTVYMKCICVLCTYKIDGQFVRYVFSRSKYIVPWSIFLLLCVVRGRLWWVSALPQRFLTPQALRKHLYSTEWGEHLRGHQGVETEGHSKKPCWLTATPEVEWETEDRNWEGWHSLGDMWIAKMLISIQQPVGPFKNISHITSFYSKFFCVFYFSLSP